MTDGLVPVAELPMKVPNEMIAWCLVADMKYLNNATTTADVTC